MNNALPPSTQGSVELDFSNLLEDFDNFMPSQGLDIPATAQNSLADPIAAIPNQKDRDSTGCDDSITVYDGCDQNASESRNPIVASVIDPLLLMNELSTSGWEWGSSKTQNSQPWHLIPEHTSPKQMQSQSPALDRAGPANYNDEGSSGRIVQPTSSGSPHAPPDEQRSGQQSIIRFFPNLPVNQIGYSRDGVYGFGKACGHESKDLFEHRSFGDTSSSNLGTIAQACPTYELTSDSEFWQPTLFQDNHSVDGPTPQQRGFVENNSFSGIDCVQKNDGSASASVGDPPASIIQPVQQASMTSRPEWPDLTRECCLLFPSRLGIRKEPEYEKENGADWISPITLDRVKKVDFLSRGLDYQAIKKNASLLVVSEIKGAELISDLIPRLDPNTIPNNSKTVLRQAENAIGAEATKLRCELVRKLRNDLSNLKRNFRRRLGMGMTVDFRPRKPGKARDGIKCTDAADRALNRRVPLTAENLFHNTPYRVCHSTKTFRAPLRLSDNGDIEWTDYPLEPARRLSEKAHEVLRNVGVNEPDFDRYLQDHTEYRTWSPNNEEHRTLGPPSGLDSPPILVHNRNIQTAGKQTVLQSPHPTSKDSQRQGVSPTQPAMNPSMMQPLPYSSRLVRNSKRSVSETGFHDLDIIEDKKVQDRIEKKVRMPKPSQASQTTQTGASNKVTGQVTADLSMMRFVQHIPMDQDDAAESFQLFAGEGLIQNDHPLSWQSRPRVHRNVE